MNRQVAGKRWVVMVAQAVVVVVLCAGLSHLMADIGYGSESDIGNFFSSASGFLIKTIGGGISVVGLIWAGIKIATGDHEGLMSAFLTIVGGAIIFLSRSIIGVLMTWTNVH